MEMAPTPEAMLPPLGGEDLQDVAMGSAGSMLPGPENPVSPRKRLRIMAVSFDNHNLDYHDEELDLQYDELHVPELFDELDFLYRLEV